MSDETVVGRDAQGRAHQYDLATQEELDAATAPTSAELVITEDASGAAGTYTGALPQPAGSTLTDMGVTFIDHWSSDIAVSLSVGVDGDIGRWVDGTGPGQFDDPGDIVWAKRDGPGIFLNVGKGWYTEADRDVLVTVVVSDTNPPGTGAFRVLVTWSLPPSSAATFEAAA